MSTVRRQRLGGATLSPSSPSPDQTPFGRISRLSPQVQELQSAPKYVDIYTGSPLGQYLSLETSPSADEALSHAQLKSPPRWKGTRGFGARHINDQVPFSLWSEHDQDFRTISTSEMRYLAEFYKAKRLEFQDCLMVIETLDPPKPIPLTVAAVPAIFVPPGQKQQYLYASYPYVGPRVPDPCPHLALKRMYTPTKSQMVNIISVLAEMANVRRVNFFPTTIVVELVYGDGRVYPTASFPAVVAGLPTTYHHGPIPFFSSMKNHARERLLDPSRYLTGIGPLPQDGTNYLREHSWGLLSPGVRVSTSPTTYSGTYANEVQSTTCGVLLRKGATECISVANHGFPERTEVFHPGCDGDKIGDIVHRYPELDIAMVQPTPSNSNRFSNGTYFQAEPPKRLAERCDLVRETWFEVDGMSTGLLSFQYIADSVEEPLRSPGHPKIPVLQWRLNTIYRIFGARNPVVIDGICGAPIVEIETGNVAGFFHLANGDFAECAALDDFVTEGWEVV